MSDEEFIHFFFAIDHLNEARNILLRIKDNPNSPLVSPAFRFAIIEYSKPYKNSEGNEKRHRLDQSCIPQEHLALHKRLVDSRDQIHAHSDLTVLEATAFADQSEKSQYGGVISNVITGLEELVNTDRIIQLIEGTLDNMYRKEPQMRRRISP
jgi:hypothetical protein